MFYITNVLKKKYILNTVIFVCALIAVFSINKILSDGSLRASNSTFSIVVFIWSYLTINYAVKKCTKSTWKFAVIMGGAFSISLVLGDNLAAYDYSRILSIRTWEKVIFLVPFVVAIFRIIEEWLIRYSVKSEKIFINDNKGSVKTFLLFWFLIFVSWLTIWLAAFPGIYAYDAVTQTAEFYLNLGLSGHHPIAHTAFLWAMISLGKNIFGTYEAGMAVYSFAQMLILSLIFAYVIYKIREWKTPRTIYIISLIMFMFIPIHGVLSISATKDVLFTGFFTLMIVFLADFGKNMDAFFNSPWKITRFILTVLAMAIFRNNGIYAFAVCVPFFIWIGRKYWKRAIVVLGCCFALYGIYMGPFSSLFGVASGDFREALSIPIQQLSRAMLYNNNELTEEEKDQIQQLIPDYKNYTSRISDSTKNTFQTDEMTSNVLGFVKLWTGVGLKCPVTYIDAFLSNSIGFWYTDMQYPDPGAFHAYIEYENTPYDFHTGGEYDIDESYLLIGRESKLPFLNQILHNWAYDVAHQGIPVISMFFNVAVYAWILVGTVLLCIIYKKWEFLPMGMAMVGLWLTCLLSPVVWIRYGYPLITGFPVLITICFKCVEKKNK